MELPAVDPAEVEAESELPAVDPAAVEAESELPEVDPTAVEAELKLPEVEEESEAPDVMPKFEPTRKKIRRLLSDAIFISLRACKVVFYFFTMQ